MDEIIHMEMYVRAWEMVSAMIIMCLIQEGEICITRMSLESKRMYLTNAEIVCICFQIVVK